jgi:hypothetical protein
MIKASGSGSFDLTGRAGIKNGEGSERKNSHFDSIELFLF